MRFADGTSWEKTRRLTEPSPHDDDLRLLAYQLMDATGLQRGRLTGIALFAISHMNGERIEPPRLCPSSHRRAWGCELGCDTHARNTRNWLTTGR
ncbi:hypothetical protein ACFT08_31260 [Streptomyces rochei]|uniref:hypothetical protein n=1 Tax=Streptomyces rochei group TaxID=2867164 RepID=UPI0035AB8ABD